MGGAKKEGWTEQCIIRHSGVSYHFRLVPLPFALPSPPTLHSVRALTHCKSIISEDGSLLVFLAHFFFGTHNILNIVQCLQLRGT